MTRAVLSASLAAIAVQLPLFAVLGLLPAMVAAGGLDAGEIGFYVSAVLIVATATMLLVGWPVFALLRHRGRVSASTMALAGLAIGVVPVALLGWPYYGLYGGYSSSIVWFGHVVDLYRNGSPTLYAWLDYLLCMMRLAVQGLVAGLVFFGVWRKTA